MAKVVGVVFFVAGLVALLLGGTGLVVSSIGSILLETTCLSSALVTTAGGAMVATSGSLFAGRFFAAKKWQQDNEKSTVAVDAMNDFNHETKPIMSAAL